MTTQRLATAGLVLTMLLGCSSDDSSVASPANPTTAPANPTTSPADSTTAPATPTTAPADSAPTIVGERLRLGEHDAVRIKVRFADWLAADEMFVYVKTDDGLVNRIDPATAAVVDAAEISGDGGVSGKGCQGIGIGFGSVWTCNGSDVVRMGLDPFVETSLIEAGKAASQGHLATGFDHVWVLQGDGSALAGIDPTTEAVGEPFPLPVRGTDLAVGDDGIWIVSAVDDAVLLVDPADGAVRHRIDDLDGPTALSVVDDAIWVGAARAVHRIDPATGSITLSIDGGAGRDGAVAADEAGVWIRRGANVRHVDATSGAETSGFTLDLAGPSPGDMLVAFGALWISASEDAALFRVEAG